MFWLEMQDSKKNHGADGRVGEWPPASKATTPRLALVQQASCSPQPSPLEMQARACVQTHCDKPAFGTRDKEASWGEAKSDFIKVSLLGQNWALAFVIYADSQVKQVKPAPGAYLSVWG